MPQQNEMEPQPIAPYRVLCWSLRVFWLSTSLAENQAHPITNHHRLEQQRQPYKKGKTHPSYDGAKVMQTTTSKRT
jgi:hypothetical protein